MIRELDNGSIVVGTNFRTIKALNVSISYADKTRVETTFTIGDILLLTYIVSGRLQRVCGDVKDIRTDNGDARIIMDFSKSHNAHIETVHVNDLKDISNVTAPIMDRHYDENGNLIQQKPTPDTPIDDNMTDQQQYMNQHLSGGDSADDFDEYDDVTSPNTPSTGDNTGSTDTPSTGTEESSPTGDDSDI